METKIKTLESIPGQENLALGIEKNKRQKRNKEIEQKPKKTKEEIVAEAEEQAYILANAKKEVIEKYPPDEIPVVAEAPVTQTETHSAEKQDFIKKTKAGFSEFADKFFNEPAEDIPIAEDPNFPKYAPTEKKTSKIETPVINEPEETVQEPQLMRAGFSFSDLADTYDGIVDKISNFLNPKEKDAGKETIVNTSGENALELNKKKTVEFSVGDTIDFDGDTMTMRKAEPVTEPENTGIEDTPAQVVETKVNGAPKKESLWKFWKRNKKEKVAEVIVGEKEVTPTGEQIEENDINKSKNYLKERLGEKEKSIASISDLVLLAGDVYLLEDPELQKFVSELWSSDKVIEEIGNGSKNMDEEKIKEVIDRISNVCGDKNLFIEKIKKLKEKSEETKKQNENKGVNPSSENKDMEKENWLDEEIKKPIVGTIENTTQEPESGKVVIENKDNNNNGKEKNEVTPENVEEFLSPSNKGFFSKMSQGAKSFMSSLYKGINKIPVVNRLVAKVEIAYNQKWIDVKEEKSVNLKGKMDELSQKIGQFEGAKQKIMARAEKLRVNGDPSYASVLLEAQRVERKQIKMANAKDTLQSRIESRENAIKLYANKRDAIADRMIEKYEKKLSPIEAKLQKNEGYRDRLNLFIAGKEAEHESKLEEFKNLQKDMDEYVAEAKDGGTSERRALRSKFIKDKKKEIEAGMKKIEHEKIQIKEEKERINNKIAKIDDKANPYRDRRNEFVRVKANRPIKIDLEERVHLINNQTTENTASHTRNDQEYSGYASYYPDTENSNNESNDRQKLVNLIPEYNEFVKKESKDVELLINEKDLFKIISKEVTVLTKEKLLGIFKGYYKMKKIPESKYLPLLAKIK